MKHRLLLWRGYRPLAAQKCTWSNRGTCWTIIAWADLFGNVKVTTVDGHWSLSDLFPKKYLNRTCRHSLEER